jgi:hypothetical protein
MLKIALLYKLQPTDVCLTNVLSNVDEGTVILNELFKWTPHSFDNHEDIGLMKDSVTIVFPAFLSTAHCRQCQGNILTMIHKPYVSSNIQLHID